MAYRSLAAIRDWTGYFDRDERRIPSQEVWDQILLPELRQAKADISARDNASYVDFRGKLPLSGTLAVGTVFSEVAGFAFRAEQPTRGETHLWRSDAGVSSRQFVVREEEGESGPNLLIGLAVTGPGWDDIVSHYRAHKAEYDGVVYLEPDNGPGDAAVTSAADAVALAVSAKNVIREYRAKYRANTIHLIFYGPATLSLFLGQRLNALGRIVTYERTGEGGYQPSIILRTG